MPKDTFSHGEAQVILHMRTILSVTLLSTDHSTVTLKRKNLFPRRAISFLSGGTWCSANQTKVISLVKMAENLHSVYRPLKVFNTPYYSDSFSRLANYIVVYEET